MFREQRYLLCASGLALALCLVLAANGRGSIDSRTRKTAEVMLTRARTANHPVALVVQMGEDEPLADVAHDAGVTQLLISETRASILPSAIDGQLLPPSVQASLIAYWVAPYLELQDYDGAVRGLARGYLDVLEQAHAVALLPRPVPILGPNKKNQTPNVYITAHWGVPLALFVVLFGAWLSQIAAHLGKANSEA